MDAEKEKVRRNLLESSTDFSLALFRKTDAAKSVVLSPFSINMALCLVHAGALENTELQMRDVMLNGSSAADLSLYFSSILKEVINAKNIEFFLANRFYMEIGLQPYKEYLAKIRTNYLADAVSIDFTKKEAAKEINDFVSECTKTKIKEVVTPEFVKDAVSLVVNALYLEADWQKKFSKASTDTLPFYVKEGKQKMIPFMEMTDYFQCYEDENVKALTMKYSNTDFRFTVLLPTKKFGLADIRESLTGQRLQQILDGGQSEHVQVTLPKMAIEYEMNLKEVLIACGMGDMFSKEKANFGGKCEKDVYCSEAIHKAIIEVDEDGTTAAAVTVIKSVERCRPIKFTANYPFIFVLDYKYNPIFIGQFIPEGNLEKATDERDSNESDSDSEKDCSSRKSPPFYDYDSSPPRNRKDYAEWSKNRESLRSSRRHDSSHQRSDSPRRSRHYQPYRYERRSYRQRETYRNEYSSRRSPSYER